MRAPGFADLEDFHHERHVVFLLEPLADVFAQDARGEGAEAFASFYLQVENVLHVRAARVAEDGAVAEGARTPFHAALEPADDFAFGDGLGCACAEGGFVVDVLDGSLRR